jgi:hypothetical protein
MRLLSIVILFCLTIQPVFAIIAIGTAQSEQEYASLEKNWPKRLILLRKLFYEFERLGKHQRTVEFLTDFHQRLKQRFVHASGLYLVGVSFNFQRLAASGYKPEMDVVINNHPLLMVKQPPLTIGSQQVPNLRPMSAETERWQRQQVRVAYVRTGGSPPPLPQLPIFWWVEDFQTVMEGFNAINQLQELQDNLSQLTVLQIEDEHGKVRYFVRIKERIFEVIILKGA